MLVAERQTLARGHYIYTQVHVYLSLVGKSKVVHEVDDNVTHFTQQAVCLPGRLDRNLSRIAES